jgi:hypothetical protein
MAAWAAKLDAFLEFNNRAVLNHAGSIRKKLADQLALEQFDAYSVELRRIEAARSVTGEAGFCCSGSLSGSFL